MIFKKNKKIYDWHTVLMEISEKIKCSSLEVGLEKKNYLK